MSPSTEIMLKLPSHASRSALCRPARDIGASVTTNDEHRRHRRADHARAFGDAADDVALIALVPGVRRHLRHVVGRHDRLGRIEARLGTVRERFDGAFEAFGEPVHRQVHADHAGRRDDDLRRPQSRAASRLGARSRARRAGRVRRCTRSRSRRSRRSRPSARRRTRGARSIATSGAALISLVVTTSAQTCGRRARSARDRSCVS